MKNIRINYIDILLSLITLCLFAVELKLLSGATNYIQLYDYIPDEALFFKAAQNYTLQSGMVFGYGIFFWYISHFLIKILPFSFPKQIFILRSFFLSLKYLAFLIMTLAVKKIRDSNNARVFYILLLTTPGYYFYGKVFSTEYLELFLIALAVFFLSQDEGKFRRFYYLSVATAITATFTKLLILPFFSFYLLYLLKYLKNFSKKIFFILLITYPTH